MAFAAVAWDVTTWRSLSYGLASYRSRGSFAEQRLVYKIVDEEVGDVACRYHQGSSDATLLDTAAGQHGGGASQRGRPDLARSLAPCPPSPNGGQRAKPWPGYHQAQLDLLIERVGATTDRYRGGKQDAFDIDHGNLQYSRAAKELCKFCALADVQSTANFIRKSPPNHWWDRGAPRKR